MFGVLVHARREAHRAGEAMVQRRHTVEQVGGDPGTRLDSLLGSCRVGGRMAYGDKDIRVDKRLDDLEATEDLGGNRRHPQMPAGRLDEPVDGRRVAASEVAQVVGAAMGGAEPGAFEVQTGEDAVVAQVGQTGQLVGQHRNGSGDEAGDDARAASPLMGHRGQRRLVAGRRRERGPAAAVDVRVHQAGGESRCVPIGFTVRVVARSDGFDGCASHLDPARLENLLGSEDAVGRQ